MNIGFESEKSEYKKTTGELKEAVISVSSILNKHKHGVLYFGVNNNGDITGQQIGPNTLRDVSRYIYDHIHPTPEIAVEALEADGRSYIKVVFNGDEQPYSAYGRYYIRVGDEDKEITRSQLRGMFFDEFTDYSAWENTLTEYTADDIDEETLITAYTQGYNKKRFPEPYTNKVSVLTKLKLLKDGKLTNAGLYLFGNKDVVLTKMALFATNEKLTFLDQNQFNGNIITCIKEGLLFISKHMRWKAEMTGGPRRDVPEVPMDAVREIVVNAYAHAKYFNTLSSHEINVFPNRIYIFSPGKLPADVVPEEYAKVDLPSELKNPTIAEVLFLCGWIERYGTGFRRAFSICDDMGIKYQYHDTKQGFVFEFMREALYSDDFANGVANATELAVLELLKQDGTLTLDEMANRVGKSARTVERAITSLKTRGYLQRLGSKTKGTWIVIK
jgi:ATP-dependent DNA helicase RecG